MKLIAILRDPVERAHSHWRLERRRGTETLSFEDALDREESELVGELERLLATSGYVDAPFSTSYVARGRYAEQLERWLELFPREQLLVLLTKNLADDPRRSMAQVADFLGVPEWQAESVPDTRRARGRGDVTRDTSTSRKSIRRAEPPARGAPRSRARLDGSRVLTSRSVLSVPTGSAAIIPGRMTEVPEISVVVPCLNEEDAVGKVVDQALEGIRRSGRRGRGGRRRQRVDRPLGRDRSRARSDRGPRGAARLRKRVPARGSPPRAASTSSWATPTARIPLEELGPFVERLECGDDLVIGSRFERDDPRRRDALPQPLRRQSRSSPGC